MSNSGKGVLALSLLGIGYAVIRLGDEFLIIGIRLLDEMGAFSGGIIRALLDGISQFDVGLETMVLVLLAIFILIATFDYVSRVM